MASLVVSDYSKASAVLSVVNAKGKIWEFGLEPLVASCGEGLRVFTGFWEDADAAWKQGQEQSSL